MKNISQTDYRLITRLVCVCVFVQAVTVKEALSAKGRHIRRSLSTPNVQHVRPDLPFTNVQKQNTVHCVTMDYNIYLFRALVVNRTGPDVRMRTWRLVITYYRQCVCCECLCLSVDFISTDSLRRSHRRHRIQLTWSFTQQSSVKRHACQKQRESR